MAECIVPLVAEVGFELCRVKREGSLGGYMCEILTENLSEKEKTSYRCPRCEGIMKDCSNYEGEQMCACCLRVGEQLQSNEPIRITIKSLKCSCPLFKRGCDWLGKLGNVEYHLAVCEYVYVSCELMCGVVLTRDEMRRHVREECTQREEACWHCSGMHKVCEMAEHVEVCGKVEVMCELGCGTRVKREDTLYHRQSECSEETVMCPYVKYGCEVVELKRRELKQHLEENRLLHTEMKLDTLEEQTEMRFNSMVESFKQQIEDLECKLNLKCKKEFLIEENQFRFEGTVKWNIKNIQNYFKPNVIFPTPGSNVSKEFAVGKYPFTLSYVTNAKYFHIHFIPSKLSNHDMLIWPLRVLIITRVICHVDIKNSQISKTPLIEIHRKDYGKPSSRVQICFIPLSFNLKDFIWFDNLEVEVTLHILKNK